MKVSVALKKAQKTIMRTIITLTFTEVEVFSYSYYTNKGRDRPNQKTFLQFNASIKGTLEVI